MPPRYFTRPDEQGVTGVNLFTCQWFSEAFPVADELEDISVRLSRFDGCFNGFPDQRRMLSNDDFREIVRDFVFFDVVIFDWHAFGQQSVPDTEGVNGGILSSKKNSTSTPVLVHIRFRTD